VVEVAALVLLDKMLQLSTQEVMAVLEVLLQLQAHP
jgi:hypothetical protein